MDQDTMVGAQIWHKAQLNLTLTREEAEGEGGGRSSGQRRFRGPESLINQKLT